MAINYSIKSGTSALATLRALQSEFAGMVDNIREDCGEEYLAALKKVLEERGEVCNLGQEFWYSHFE